MITRSKLSQLAAGLAGLPVYGCLPGSPAAEAGVRYGDVLLSVDGQSTPSWDAYLAARAQSGKSIRLKLFRDGRQFEVDLTLNADAYLDTSTVAATLGLLGAAEEQQDPN